MAIIAEYRSLPADPEATFRQIIHGVEEGTELAVTDFPGGSSTGPPPTRLKATIRLPTRSCPIHPRPNPR